MDEEMRNWNDLRTRLLWERGEDGDEHGGRDGGERAIGKKAKTDTNAEGR